MKNLYARCLLAILLAALCSCGIFFFFSNCSGQRNAEYRNQRLSQLADSIASITAQYHGEIGVALIVGSRDTVTVANRSVYPMMSVFKLHQAIVVCDFLDKRGIGLDTVMNINAGELDRNTWSPMLKDYDASDFSITASELLRYALTASDNNASNIMFNKIVSAGQTDTIISRIIPRESFRIAFTEADMSRDHDKAYRNFTSPLGAAALINKLFSDSLVSDEKQTFIKTALAECVTGQDRISAPLLSRQGVVVSHKTGSGYINAKGQLAAHNDVSYISLPDGNGYALAVLVKDFDGDEKLASEAISRISEVVYSFVAE